MNEAGLMEAKFEIVAENVQPAQQAAKNLALQAKNTGRRYAWVDVDELLAPNTLEATFLAWGWQLSFNSEGAVCGIDGPTDAKVADEKVLFDALAPFVQEGSYVQIICDSDNSIWRWMFRDGYCIEAEAELVFPDRESMRG